MAPKLYWRNPIIQKRNELLLRIRYLVKIVASSNTEILLLGIIMKALCILLITFQFYGCADFAALNNQIYESQLQAVQHSTYKSAKGTEVYVEAQREFRLNNLPKLIKEKLKEGANLKDTILMTESFNAICINCPSYRMSVLLEDTIYSLLRNNVGRNKVKLKTKVEPLTIVTDDFNYELRNCAIIEIITKIRNKESWLENPLQYGGDYCSDGDHTLITVIYPDRRTEALYVRCWRPSFYRNRK